MLHEDCEKDCTRYYSRDVNLDTWQLSLLFAGITIVAFLYSSVGHAGEFR